MKNIDYFFTNDAGRIVRKGVAPENMIHLQVPHENESFHVGSCNGATHYRNEEFLTQPPKPSLAHDWDEANFVWVLNEARKLEIAAVGVRAKRDALLAQSDWTQLPDVPIADNEAWAVYRQALRDITEQPGFPTDVVWPEAP